jgi:predicted CXXCH cytochrome family protein
MKLRTLLLAVCAAGVTWLTASGDIINTAHNFTSSGFSGGEICKPCHTPHFADEIGYLWAHELSNATYTLFDGTTSSAGGVDELDKYSRMCLSCHDGTVALNNFHNGGGTDVFIGAGANLGTDLSNDHPIGSTAEYPVAGSSQFNAATLSAVGFYGFGPGFFPEVPLFPFDGADGVVSCSTCHNPHGKPGIPNLLRKDNAGSALCLTCHIK